MDEHLHLPHALELRPTVICAVVQLCSYAVVQRKPDLTLVCRNLYYSRLTRQEPTLKRALFGSRLYVHAICAN